jgi:SAM-dependent methyltransferase
MVLLTVPGIKPKKLPPQCQHPRGWRGKFILWSMNRRHSKVTDWGLQQISVRNDETILDVGCGGGRTVSKLAAAASAGVVHGIDFAAASVAAAIRTNRLLIAGGRVAIQQASVTELPFADDTFDLVTAVETHFWWPDLDVGMRECFRATAELESQGYRMLVKNKTEPWGQTVSRFLAPEGLLIGITFTPALRTDAGY